MIISHVIPDCCTCTVVFTQTHQFLHMKSQFDTLIFPSTSSAWVGVLVLIPTPLAAWMIKLSLWDTVCPPIGSRKKTLSFSICPQIENMSEFDPDVILLLHHRITERFQFDISLLSHPKIVLNIHPFYLSNNFIKFKFKNNEKKFWQTLFFLLK